MGASTRNVVSVGRRVGEWFASPVAAFARTSRSERLLGARLVPKETPMDKLETAIAVFPES